MSNSMLGLQSDGEKALPQDARNILAILSQLRNFTSELKRVLENELTTKDKPSEAVKKGLVVNPSNQGQTNQQIGGKQ